MLLFSCLQDLLKPKDDVLTSSCWSSFILNTASLWLSVTSFGDNEHKVDLKPFINVRPGPNGLQASLLCFLSLIESQYFRPQDT